MTSVAYVLKPRKTLNELTPETTRMCELYRDLLLDRFGGDFVSLAFYGSRARGDNKVDSDADFLAVVNDLPASFWDRCDLFRPLQRKVEQETGVPFVSTLMWSPEGMHGWKFLYLDMTEDAVVVFDRDGFFEGVLEDMAARMRRLGSVRKWVDDKWYWVIKPDSKPGERIEL